MSGDVQGQSVVMQGCRTNFWGQLIYQLRSERRLSQRKLADEAQVNRSTLRRIEEGTARGDIDVIERLLGHMGYELEALRHESLDIQRRLEAEAAADPAKRAESAANWLVNPTWKH